jgi:hypothetical protein
MSRPLTRPEQRDGWNRMAKTVTLPDAGTTSLNSTVRRVHYRTLVSLGSPRIHLRAEHDQFTVKLVFKTASPPNENEKGQVDLKDRSQNIKRRRQPLPVRNSEAGLSICRCARIAQATAMPLCPGYGPLDLDSSCIRSTWATLLPSILTAAVVLVLIIQRLPLPQRIWDAWATVSSPFVTFLTLEEAEAYNETTAKEIGKDENKQRPRAFWQAVFISSVSLVSACVWLALGAFRLVQAPQSYLAWSALVTSIPWIYTIVRPFALPFATPPFDLFWIFILKLAASVFYFIGMVYDKYVFEVPLPAPVELTAVILNFAAILGVLGVIIWLPMAIPSAGVDKEQIVSFLIPILLLRVDC